jgi:hypothetical protein
MDDKELPSKCIVEQKVYNCQFASPVTRGSREKGRKYFRLGDCPAAQATKTREEQIVPAARWQRAAAMIMVASDAPYA